MGALLATEAGAEREGVGQLLGAGAHEIRDAPRRDEAFAGKPETVAQHGLVPADGVTTAPRAVETDGDGGALARRETGHEDAMTSAAGGHELQPARWCRNGAGVLDEELQHGRLHRLDDFR